MKLKPKLILVLTIVFIMIGSFAFYFFYGTPWNLISYKNKFNEYLENKYSKDFVIEKISFDFFHGKTYHAYAHPKKNPELTFYVGQNPSNRKIEDSYLFQTLQKQAKDELGPIIEKFFPDNFNYAVEIYPINNLSISEASQIFNFKEYSTVDVDVSMNDYKITSENRDDEIERTYLLLVALKETGITFNHFGIGYKNKTIQLQPNDILSISSPYDLKKWLHDYR